MRVSLSCPCIASLLIAVYVHAQSSEGELIPRSMSERANYYLLSVTPDGEFLRTLHKRVGSSGVGYSITRIDCKTRRYQDLGYGDDAEANIRMYDSVKWTTLVEGSSKSDMVSFVCNRSSR
jgi:hypothetical protein